jgi:DNA-binding MarR family transcriptional regulator
MIISELNNRPDNQSSDLPGEWAGYLLNQAALRIRVMTSAALGPLGLTPPHLRALEVIAAHQPLSQTRLGDLTQLDRSTVVHVVDHFEQLGAATRGADPTDRRTHAVSLTKSGMALLAEARSAARTVERDFLAPLSRDQQAALRDALRQLFDPTPCPEEKERESSPPPPNPG